MIRRMASECIRIWTGRGMRDSGKKISSTGKDRSHGQMARSMMEITLMERSMGKEHSDGLIMQLIKEISMITIFMDLEHTSGLTGESTLAIGRIIKCMAEVSLNGRMEEDMREVMLMTRRKVKAFLNGKLYLEILSYDCIGLMVGNILVAG